MNLSLLFFKFWILSVSEEFTNQDKNYLENRTNPYHGSLFGHIKTKIHIEGDIGVCGIAVLANFSCGISVILILNCGIAVFSKPAGCVFLAFWTTIVGI